MDDKKAISLIDKYLNRASFTDYLFSSKPSSELKTVIVIPAFAEEFVEKTIESLFACESPKYHAEIIVIINQTEGCDEESRKINDLAFEKLSDYASQNSRVDLKLLVHPTEDLPAKHGGVGLARKIGMDEAVRRFKKANVLNGHIVCFDADCEVSPNYINAIQDHYDSNPESPGASIYFEHPVKYEGIVFYELFLRYYNNALRYANYPYAYHTVGSSMTVNLLAYVMEGGMNRRKAAEDFYFLHKVIPRGDFGEINACTIFPSDRESTRVPFGTGKAMLEFNQEIKDLRSGYNFQIFKDLKELFKESLSWYGERENKEILLENYSKWPESIKTFIPKLEFIDQVEEATLNSKSERTFLKRIYQWLEAFKVLKMVHYLRDYHYPNDDLLENCQKLLIEIGHSENKNFSALEILKEYRKLDREAVLLEQIIKI